MTTQQSNERIEIVPGVTGPKQLVASFPALYSVRGGRLDLTLTIDYNKDLSRYVVREMAVRAQTPGGYVTAEDLRDVPLASVLPVVFEEEDVIQDLPNPDDHEPWGRVPPANVKDYRVPAILPWVAQVYRLAWAVGSNPTKDVQEKFGGIPRSTAANWIDKARDAGLLKRTRQGKGGV